MRDSAARGAAVLLTTQDMEEASVLADEIVVLVGGKVVRVGPPSELTAGARQARIRVTLPNPRPELLAATLAALGPAAEASGRVVTVPAPNALTDLAAVVDRLRLDGIDVHDVGLEQPTLSEIYAELTAERPDADPVAPAHPIPTTSTPSDEADENGTSLLSDLS